LFSSGNEVEAPKEKRRVIPVRTQRRIKILIGGRSIYHQCTDGKFLITLSLVTVMSNESVQAHLAITAQSIAQTGKPVIRPKSEYTEFFSQYCRAGYGVAKVFSYLVLRNQRNKPGDNPARLEVQREGGRWGTRGYWWLDTLKEMADVCQISIKQVRTALDILERLNQIEARQGRHSINGVVSKYRGKTVLHIRLIVCERGNGIDCWPTVEQMRIVLECPKGHPIKCPQGHSLLPDAKEVLDTKEGNIKDAGAGNTPASTTPETIQQSGKGITPKTEQASEPFLKICLSRKLEFIKLDDNGENTPCVLAELTPEDLNTAQRLEHELTKAGLDPLDFVGWLTPQRFKHIALINLDNAMNWGLFVVMSHREMFFDKYRAYLAERSKYTSAQQLVLNAMAPQAMKLSIPLYEENPGLVAAMFGHADYWREQQIDGLLGGKTLAQYLAGWQWITPAMMEWLDNEAVRERVEDLLTVHDAAAA
jgi:hypothetical protein